MCICRTESGLDVSNEVVVIIDGLIDTKQVFTAFDITKMIRNQMNQETIRHKRVKRFVKEILTQKVGASYSVSVIDLSIDNKNVPALVYHPDTVDPNTHPLAADKPSTNTNDSDTTTSTDSKTTIKELTSEKRLNIPVPMLVKVGLIAGKKAVIDNSSSDKIRITIGNDSQSGVIVNADGRFRLSLSQLKPLNIGGVVDRYEIKLEKDSIFVSVPVGVA